MHRGGVRQGRAMSPSLVRLLMDTAVREMEARTDNVKVEMSTDTTSLILSTAVYR